MTRVCGLDIETTGLSFQDDHITEIAWVIKDTGDSKPLAAKTFFVLPPENLFISPEIEQLTKIKMKHLQTGYPLEQVLSWLALDITVHAPDFIVAHNGENFDKPFLQAKAALMGEAVLDPIFGRQWLDTSVDVVYPPDCRYTNLMYVAAYYGFINPFPHAALFDTMTMLKVLDQQDILAAATRAASPWVVVKANVSYDDRDKAKARRYWWETIGNDKYPKQWVKKIKELDLAKEIAEAPFPVIRIA